MSFSNKVVIVTGGSSGIGASTAIQFATEGAKVTIVGRNEDKLKQVADKISQVGKPALVVKADITRDVEAKQVIQKTVEKFGKIDVLVNNAGGSLYSNVGDENFVETFDSVMNTNLRSAMLITTFAVPYLKHTKGNIINVSSAASKTVAGGGRAPYCSAKAALDQFTRNCAHELAELGIRANVVSPGPVKTSFLEAAGVENADYQTIADKNTALRLLTQPEEIADTILHLASDKARSVTGSDYVIDAGYLVNGRKSIGSDMNFMTVKK